MFISLQIPAFSNPFAYFILQFRNFVPGVLFNDPGNICLRPHFLQSLRFLHHLQTLLGSDRVSRAAWAGIAQSPGLSVWTLTGRIWVCGNFCVDKLSSPPDCIYRILKEELPALFSVRSAALRPWWVWVLVICVSHCWPHASDNRSLHVCSFTR